MDRTIDIGENVACAAVFLTDRRGGFSGSGPLWVKYFRRGSGFHSFVWPGTSPPSNSVALSSYRDGNKSFGPALETWSVRGQSKTWLVEAAKLPVIPENPDYPKVVALLHPSR